MYLDHDMTTYWKLTLISIPLLWMNPCKIKLKYHISSIQQYTENVPIPKGRDGKQERKSEQRVTMLSPTNLGLTTRNFHGPTWVPAHLGNVTLLPMIPAAYVGVLMSQHYLVFNTSHERWPLFLISTMYNNNYYSIGFTFTASQLLRTLIVETSYAFLVYIVGFCCFLESWHKPLWPFYS